MHLTDSHCHLYLEEFKADIDNVIEQAKQTGVTKFYFPNVDSTTIDAMLQLEAKYPKNCFAMMGLHPCSVKENYKDELAVIKSWLDKRPFAAVGEIGLDFYWDTSFKAQQFEAFELQMQWALEKQMPVVIHTRNAIQQSIDTVKPFAAKGLRGIFHCFDGTADEAKQITEMNFLLGIGGVITYKKSALDLVLPSIDLTHIVLETDAPYLAPVPFRGKRNESKNLEVIAAKLAAIKSMLIEEVAEVTTANALKFFKRS